MQAADGGGGHLAPHLQQHQQQQQSYNFKVVLLGEGCVGKTSLVLRYVDDRFNPNHITTLQASFLAKKLNINGKRVSLSIWDTAGQERFVFAVAFDRFCVSSIQFRPP